MVLRGTQRVNEVGRLEVGGCDAVDLARRFGTPLYVMDEELIRRNCRSYREAFRRFYPHETRIAYAGKAFLVVGMCKLIQQEGLWLDVSSAGELYTALQANFPAEKIYLHGNFKPDQELEMGLRHRVHRLVVDSEDELVRLNELASLLKTQANVLLRVTPGVEAHTHEYIRTGQIDTKFGIPIEDGMALRAVRRTSELKQIRLHGFHCHIGSQIFDIEPFEIAVELMIEFFHQVREETGQVFDELNVGGGLGVRYVDEDDPPNIEDFAASLSNAVVNSCRRLNYPLPILALEPGRSIVGEAGTTLYTIGVIKEVPSVRTYVAVDGGMSDNPRPSLYGARYQALIADKANHPATFLCTVAGRHCESDILIRDVLIAPPEPGDILAVFTTGAYNHSMSSNYNRFPRPAVVLVKDGQADLIATRESLEDLVRHDVIPPRLQSLQVW